MIRCVFALLILMIIISGCGNKKTSLEISCGFENSEGDNFIILGNSNIKISGANSRSKNFSRNGKYSLILSNENPYGFSFVLDNVKENDYIFITAWVKSESGKGTIVVSGDSVGEYYTASAIKYEDDDNGWYKLALEAYVPPSIAGKRVKVYLWNGGTGTVYFDDITVFKSSGKNYIQYPKNKTLSISFSKSENDKLQKIRNKALEHGVLVSKNKDFMSVDFKCDTFSYEAEARLKGDWTDHLIGKKWSFRIKTKGDKFWNGMRTFSIQSPLSRSFLNEWVAHKFFIKEGLLTTRYGFIPVCINGSNTGIYAYEEHFDKQLLEFNNRREGPIIKLNEEFFWEFQRHYIKGDVLNVPFFLSADILPFNEKRIKSSSSLKNQFVIAQNLLNQYKNGDKLISEIFDVEQAAKFYAIADITCSYHALLWHNLRFYYNPVTSKLELIAYDCFTENGSFDWVKKPYIGLCGEPDSRAINFILQAFNDSVFVKYYNYYLRMFSNEDYINNSFKEFNKELTNNEEFIKTDFSYYNYDYSFIKNRAKDIRENLIIVQPKINPTKFSYEFSENTDTTLYKYLIKAYTEEIVDSKKRIRIFSYLPEKLTIVGFGEKKDSINDNVKVELPAFKSTIPFVDVIINKNDDLVFYSTSETKRIKKIKIFDWPSPSKKLPPEDLQKTSVFMKYFKIQRDSVLVYNGSNTSIANNIIIPRGYKVVFNPGNQLDLIKNACFISYSPIFMNGTSQKPILVKSSDNTCNGFTILSAKTKSSLNYVTFDGMNTLDFNGWVLTGSVNFYESDVDINNVKIINNKSEDALNIIRSKFIINNTEFRNIFSDAFDSDFSSGSVNLCKFYKIGNDAIDFSGSNVDIDNVFVENAGDKGISGGEKSNLTIRRCEIINANIGIASKDLTELNLSDIKIDSCKYGLVLLQKKPEYGHAKIIAKSISIKNTEKEYLIEKGSILLINDKEIIGENSKLAEIFYQ